MSAVRSHRRTQSEEVLPQDFLPAGTPTGNQVENFQSYNNRNIPPISPRTTTVSAADGRNVPGGHNRHHGRERVQSLPVANQSPFFFGDGTSGEPPLPLPPNSQHRRKRKQQLVGSSRNHHRTYSYDGYKYDEMYQQQQSRSSASPRRDFSPRGEIMSLARGLSPRQTSSQKKGLTPPASPVTVAAGSSYQRGLSPGNRLSSSPYRGHHKTMSHPSIENNSPRVPLSPATRNDAHAVIPSDPPVYRDMVTGNGFVGGSYGAIDSSMAQQGHALSERQLSGQSTPRSAVQSTRKMHMRQQSAQVYMEDIKGTTQPRACRDVLFALLFICHLAGMVYLGLKYGPDALRPVAEVGGTRSVFLAYRNVIFVSCLSGLFAVGLSSLALVLMTIFARRVVQVSLILTIGLSFAWGTIGIGLSPRNIVPISGIIALALSVGYTFVVWDRIPFAASNLLTASCGIRENAGTIFIAFIFQGFALLWSIYYTFVAIGVYDAIEAKEINLGQHSTIFVFIMLGLSYYWTFHVLLNVVQVTVAGTIGDWWFIPTGESSCCTMAILTKLLHASTTSFGSICFGSLFVGPVRLLRQLSVFFRPSSEDDSVLMCLHECLRCIQTCVTNCTDELANCLNPWAFTYVGLYGYGLLDAGSNATALFKRRGWTIIVADDLIPNILLMVSLVIGGVTGCFGFLIQELDELNFTNFSDPSSTAFLIGLAVGLVVTSVLFGIMSSSVNTVLVCFAGSPLEFEKNHPRLSQEMRANWREVWPGCMDVVDVNFSMLQEQGTPLLHTNDGFN